MKRTVTLVDYSLGNLRAFEHIYAQLNRRVIVAKSPAAIETAEALILPGVGSFDWAMTKLNQSGLRASLEDKVLRQKTPILGVCVGMQMLAEASEEGTMSGLGWIEGEVRKLSIKSEKEGLQRAVGEPQAKDEKPENVKSWKSRNEFILPHMGWNDVHPADESNLFKEISSPQFYFLHSYYFVPKFSIHSLGTTEYGSRFTSVVGRQNIYGVQFHPEKSHGWGIQLLKNFVEKC